MSLLDKMIIDAAYRSLERVMIDPNRPNKNKGETCSFAYAKRNVSLYLPLMK